MFDEPAMISLLYESGLYKPPSMLTYGFFVSREGRGNFLQRTKRFSGNKEHNFYTVMIGNPF